MSENQSHEVTIGWVESSVAVFVRLCQTHSSQLNSWMERAASRSQTHICPWKSEPTFQCTRKIKPLKDKNTPANLPQSANTVVKLTGLPDLLHTLKKHNLSASSSYEWAETCCMCTQSHTWHLLYLITVRQQKKEKKNNFVLTSCKLIPEITLKKQLNAITW